MSLDSEATGYWGISSEKTEGEVRRSQKASLILIPQYR